jgi:2-methylisocitrate lyase-like PEP mutase family enzyme
MHIKDELRNLLSSEDIVVAPGCHDALGAKMIAQSGFKAVYMSGNATTASLIGMPDLGLLGMSEMVNRARMIATAAGIPLICDADTGYGGIHNVIRTVQEYEAAGVAGIHIEDQALPKRCGAMENVRVAGRLEAEERLRVALDARSDKNFLIIARSDARVVEGLEEAWWRGERFAELGADLVYIEGLQSREEIEETARRFEGTPLFFNVVEVWPWTLIPAKELGEMGFKIVIFCLSPTLLYASVFKKYLEALKQDGTTSRLTNNMLDLHEYEKILGIETMEAKEKQFTK